MIAATLSLALVLTSPGIMGYEALAGVIAGASVGSRGAAGAPASAGASLSAAGNQGTASPLGRTAASGLGTALPSISGLTFEPVAANALASQSGAFSPAAPAAGVSIVGRVPARGLAAKETAPAVPGFMGTEGRPAWRGGSHAVPGFTGAKGRPAKTGFLGAVIKTLIAAIGPKNAPKADSLIPSALDRAYDGSTARDASGPAAIGRAGRGLAPGRAGLVRGTTRTGSNGVSDKAVPKPSLETSPAAPAKTTPKGVFAYPWVKYGAPLGILAGTAILFNANLLPIAIISGSLMFSILAHESAHILGLRIWGDPSPKEAGRDTINPFRHIDPFGTIILPALSLAVSQALIGFPLLFGWAKPVPVDFNNLKDVQHDAAKVAALGPITNFALAALAGAAWLALPAMGLVAAGGTAAFILATLFKMNLALGVFNLLPLPWLDGGKLLVSMFPKNLYARWTANPNLPEGYQGIFRKIYEGPANLLSHAHVHKLEQVNGLTRVASLAALGAFYALFFTTLQVPFLFLALPCSYDYWCIREKVRSEQAVEEMMDLMSEWGAALVQIAEDHDAESEVSAFEAEHAMKNAVDQLLEDLMLKEEFRALSDEDKIKEFMRIYPDMAVRFLKEKVLTEDSEDKIREILADARNKPFFERLEKWLKDHKVFEKMHSPHAKKKLKDSMKEADEKRTRENGGTPMGGYLPLLLLPAALILPEVMTSFSGVIEPVYQAIAALGIGSAAFMLGSLNGTGDFNEETSEPGPVPYSKIVVAGDFGPRGRIRVILNEGADAAALDAALEGVERLSTYSRPDSPNRTVIELNLRDAVTAGQKAMALARLPGVAEVQIHREVDGHFRFSGRRDPPAPEAGGPAEPAVPSAEASVRPEAKIRKAVPNDGEKVFRLTFKEGVSASAAEEAVKAVLQAAGQENTLSASEKDGKTVIRVEYRLTSETEEGQRARRELMLRLAELEQVETAAVNPGLISMIPDAANEDDGAGAALLERVASADDLPDRKDYRVTFKPDATPEQKDDLFKKYLRFNAAKYFWETPDTIRLHVRDDREGVRLVTAALMDESVAGVATSAAGKESLAGVMAEAPEAFTTQFRPDAAETPEAVNEDLGVLIQFLEGSEESLLKEFGRRYSLTLIEADYRGAAGLALFTVPETADPAWYISTLAETIRQEPESQAASVKALREREGVVTEPAAAAAAERGEAVRRDTRSEWLEWLNHRTLIDGRSTLTPEQVKGLAQFLKPVQPPATESKHPTIGRTKEIKKILPILTSPRGMRNSVMLIGEPGVGKTAIAEGLAQLIEDADFAEALRASEAGGETRYLDLQRLRGRWLVELDVDRLLTSDDPVGTLMALLELLPMLNDPKPNRGNEVILLVDEIQKLMMDNAGQKIANAIKGHLRDGKISVMATTTSKEYKQYIESDGALARRFQTVVVKEPSVGETIEMMRGAKEYYESQHDADIPEETLEAAAKLSHQFDKERFLPDKAIKLVEDAAELARPDNLRGAIALDIREGWRRLNSAINEAREALTKKKIASTIALPVELFNRVADQVKAIVGLYDAQSKIENGKGRLTLELIKKTLADATGISAGQLTLGEEDASKYVKMEGEIGGRVINQERALTALANAIRRNKAGLSNPNRPMGKFLFAGPTGTGKTHLVKELARFLFNDPESYIRFDMSEFMEEHTYMRLVGAPPSYVGFGQGGQLTEAVRKRPYSVILFDEIEKAHPKVWDIFLQILDDGRLTDSEGRVVDFKNTVIIFTSNVGMGVVDSERYARLLEAKQGELAAFDGKKLPAEAETPLQRETRTAEAWLAKTKAGISDRYDAEIARRRAAVENEIVIAAQAKALQVIAALEERRDQEIAEAAAKFRERLAAAREAGEAPKAEGAASDAAREAVLKDIAEIEAAWDAEIDLAIKEGVKMNFRPELINRLDEDPLSKSKWVRFNRLNEENIRVIARLQLKEFTDLLNERHGTELVIDDEVFDLLVREGFSPLYGARPMQGAIEKFIVDPLAKWILEVEQAKARGEESAGEGTGRRIEVSVREGQPHFESLPKPEKVVERTSLEGVAHRLTHEIMELVSDLVADELGETPEGGLPEPSEELFDKWLKGLLAGASSGPAPAPQRAAPKPVFSANASFGVSGAVVLGAENNPRKKDKGLKAAADGIVETAKNAGWDEASVDILEPEAGKPGEGWIKHFISHAKKMSSEAGVSAPVKLTSSVGKDAIRLSVHSDHEMSEREKQSLQLHLTGTPPKSLKAAQQRADEVNMTSPIIRDHNLLDLYRRVSDHPGARVGYATSGKAQGGSGTDYWIEISQSPRNAETAEGNPDKKTVSPSDRRSPSPRGRDAGLTPHQVRQRAKTRDLLLQTVTQDAMSPDKQDGPAVKIAAAEAWAMLSTPQDLPTVRSWILENKWATSPDSVLTTRWPQLMAMALVMKRHGTAADAAVLEGILRRLTSYSHFHVPVKNAVIDALAATLVRGGREAALAAAERAGPSAPLKRAAALALGEVGTLDDLVPFIADEELKDGEPEAYVALLARLSPDRLKRHLDANLPRKESGSWSDQQWRSLSDSNRITLFRLMAKGSDDPARDLEVIVATLKNELSSSRVTAYAAAEALAEFALRGNLIGGLRAQLEHHLERKNMTSYDEHWKPLLALIYAAQRVGTADLLPALEEIMKMDPGRISSSYEQPYFEVPMTWAKIAVRSGAFAEMAKPTLDAEGKVQLSKIQRMLASKDPMLAAAALYAIGLSQQKLGGHGTEEDASLHRPESEPGELPDLYGLGRR